MSTRVTLILNEEYFLKYLESFEKKTKLRKESYEKETQQKGYSYSAALVDSTRAHYLEAQKELDALYKERDKGGPRFRVYSYDDVYPYSGVHEWTEGGPHSQVWEYQWEKTLRNLTNDDGCGRVTLRREMEQTFEFGRRYLPRWINDDE